MPSVHVHVCVHVSTHVHVYIVCMCAYCVGEYTHLHVHGTVFICTYMCLCTRVCCVYTCVCMCDHIPKHLRSHMAACLSPSTSLLPSRTASSILSHGAVAQSSSSSDFSAACISSSLVPAHCHLCRQALGADLPAQGPPAPTPSGLDGATPGLGPQLQPRARDLGGRHPHQRMRPHLWLLSHFLVLSFRKTALDGRAKKKGQDSLGTSGHLTDALLPALWLPATL